MKPEEALDAIFAITDTMSFVYPSDKTVYVATELVRKHNIKSNAVFDAYLVATMLSCGVDEIATDNERDIKLFEGIKVHNPFKG